MQGHNYLVPGPTINWEAIARAQLRRGSQQPEGRQPEARDAPGQANEAGEPQEGDDSGTLLAVLSGTSSDVSGTKEGREGSVAMLASPGGERKESPPKRIPLTLKSSGRLNIQQSTELGRRPALGDMKSRGLLDDENCDERKSKRFRLVSMAREFLESEEGWKRSASHYDEGSLSHERKPKRFRSSLHSESLMDLTARLSFSESA